MKILVSACLLGENVRWNGANKESRKLIEWAEENNVQLEPVCPEDELFGTPRQPIRLIQIDDKISALVGEKDVIEDLVSKSEEIHLRHHDAVGFIGISGSPSCGISVGVKKMGGMTKGTMHSTSKIPTTEIGHFKNVKSQEAFLNRIDQLQNLEDAFCEACECDPCDCGFGSY